MNIDDEKFDEMMLKIYWDGYNTGQDDYMRKKKAITGTDREFLLKVFKEILNGD